MAKNQLGYGLNKAGVWKANRARTGLVRRAKREQAKVEYQKLLDEYLRMQSAKLGI